VTTLDLREPRAVHIVGVGGAGMSAIATVLSRMGHRVSGSDLKESATLARLRLLGVDAQVGHAAERLPAALDAVVVSTAIPASNPEVAAAETRGVPVLRKRSVRSSRRVARSPSPAATARPPCRRCSRSVCEPRVGTRAS
jgi:UDP-N-acetylmuramate-alanine ligase